MSFRPEDLPEGAINTKEIDGLWKYFASVSLLIMLQFKQNITHHSSSHLLQLDWREHWVQGLAMFHILTSAIIFLTRQVLDLYFQC